MMRGDLLEKLGWTFSPEKFEENFQRAMGKPPTETERTFYRALAPYVALAYQAGKERRELSESFPFLALRSERSTQ